MKIITDDIKERKLAKIPHEIFTINTTIIHLFLAVAILKFANPKLAIIIPIAISVIIIIASYLYNKNIQLTATTLVKLNWHSSMRLYRILIIAYIFYFIITIVGFIAGKDAPVSMDGENIINNIFLILAVIPLFISVFITTVVASGYMFNAMRGEVSIKLLDSFTKKSKQSSTK